MSKILVVDDKEMMRDSVAATLARRGHAVITAPGGKPALEKILQRRPDAVITDLQMPDMDGLALLREIRAQDDALPVVFMTAYGTIETAVRAMREGAFDYITKPFSGDELCLAIERAIEHRSLVRENQVLRAAASERGAAPGREHAMVGSGRAMTALRERLAKFADSHGTVLISGESGTGKEVAARWLHARGPRRDKPFLAMNCAALSTSLLESELFGHEKGAFTGADKTRKGRFELADGGTLLLDEISEIEPRIQAKLLRVLQEGTFERVGSSAARTTDVRVIATTNRRLTDEVARGTFREDLYFRLNVLPLALPPLRDRTDDLPELVEHFLGLVAAREGRPPKSLAPDAMDLLAQYRWPGNIRELQNIVERAVVLTSGEEITADLIRPWLAFETRVEATSPEIVTEAPDVQRFNGRAHGRVNGAVGEVEATPLPLVCDGDLTLETIEREAVVATLERFGGHRQKSAAALGIGVRTLGLKLKKWKDEALVAEDL